MDIRIKEVQSKADLKTFVYLPAQIHKNHSNWVPPIYMDDLQFFNPKKNKAFSYSDTIMLLAFRAGKPVGRVMGIIQKRYNQEHNENHARFGFIETYEDQQVFDALMERVEQWAKQKGCEAIVGPLGFTDKDPQGFLVEGFDQPIVIASNANFPFMPKFIENRGYRKKVDLVVYKVPLNGSFPQVYQYIYQRVMRNGKYKVVEFKTRRQLKPYIRPVLRLLNETFTDIYAFSPFEEYEMDEFANRYIYLLDPEFIKVIEDNQGNLLAFIIAMPDISEGVKKANGRILPFGLIKILRSQKKTKQLNLLLGGIKEQYRGKGLDVVLAKHLWDSAKKHGFEYADSHLELEYNTRVRKEMERFGGKVYKRYRIYQKDL